MFRNRVSISVQGDFIVGSMTMQAPRGKITLRAFAFAKDRNGIDKVENEVENFASFFPVKDLVSNRRYRKAVGILKLLDSESQDDREKGMDQVQYVKRLSAMGIDEARDIDYIIRRAASGELQKVAQAHVKRLRGTATRKMVVVGFSGKTSGQFTGKTSAAPNAPPAAGSLAPEIAAFIAELSEPARSGMISYLSKWPWHVQRSLFNAAAMAYGVVPQLNDFNARWNAAHKQEEKGFFDKLASTLSHSVALQALAAMATGGLSLVAQAAWGAATGDPTPVNELLQTAIKDPAAIAKAIPGTLLTETGAVGLGLTALSALGVKDADNIKLAAQKDPESAGKILAGVAMLAAGAPGGKDLIAQGVSKITNLPQAQVDAFATLMSTASQTDLDMMGLAQKVKDGDWQSLAKLDSIKKLASAGVPAAVAQLTQFKQGQALLELARGIVPESVAKKVEDTIKSKAGKSASGEGGFFDSIVSSISDFFSGLFG